VFAGQFKPGPGAKPAIGSVGQVEYVEEDRVELVVNDDGPGQVELKSVINELKTVNYELHGCCSRVESYYIGTPLRGGSIFRSSFRRRLVRLVPLCCWSFTRYLCLSGTQGARNESDSPTHLSGYIRPCALLFDHRPLLSCHPLNLLILYSVPILIPTTFMAYYKLHGGGENRVTNRFVLGNYQNSSSLPHTL